MLLLERHMLEANHDDKFFFFFGKFVNFCLVFPMRMIDLQIGRKKPLMCMHKGMHARAFLHTHTHTHNPQLSGISCCIANHLKTQGLLFNGDYFFAHDTIG